MMGQQAQNPQLVAILQQLLLSDNDAVQNAQSQLKKFMKQPDSLTSLATILTANPDDGVRQMAATLLRQRITKSWIRVAADAKAYIKHTLLTCVISDKSRGVRQAIARVISIIAKHEVPNNEWPDFMAWLSQCTSSEDVQVREIGFLVLSYVCEAMGDQLRPFYKGMFPMLQSALEDTRSVQVPLNAIQTLSHLLPYFETDELEMVRQMLPGLVIVCKRILEHDDADGMAAMEFFDELVEGELKMTNEDLVLLVSFFLEVASMKDTVDPSVRTAALQHVINVTYTDKKKQLMRSGVLPQIVQAAFNIMSEPVDAEDVDDEEEETPVPVVAGLVIQSFSMNLSAQAVVGPALEVVGRAMNDPDKHRRKAAQVLLYSLVEGCSETIRPLLAEIMPVMYKGLDDPEMLVREHACLALAEFSQWLQPQISAYKDDVLPRLFASLQAPSEQVQIKSLYAMNCFSDQLGDDIIPYLPAMMQQLALMIQTGSLTVKENTVLAIASAAIAAGKAFEPYLRDVYAYLKSLLTLEGEENTSLRAYATDTLGSIIKNMGRTYFEADLQEIMNAAMANLNMDDPEVHTCTFGLFGSIASAFGEDFAPYLPTLIEHMVNYIVSEEGIIEHRSSEDALANVDSDDESDVEAVTVDPIVFDAKQAAIDVLGVFSQSCPRTFSQYLATLTDTLVPLLKFDYSTDLRKASVTTLCEFIQSSNKVFPPAAEWQPGLPVRVPLSPQTQALVTKIMPEIIALMKTDYDRMVVLAATEGLDPLLPAVGPAVIAEYIDAWCALLVSIMSGQVTCQSADAEDDEDAEKTVAEYDAQLIENACDLVGTTAALLGPSFSGNYFTTFAKFLHKFYKKNSTVGERSCCMGTFADIINGMKDAIQPYAADMYELLAKGLADPDHEVRSNAAFAMGLLCEYGGAALQPQYMNILQRLYPLFSNQPAPEVTDNACGAVSRMVLGGGAALPLDKVMPVLVAALPLKRDYVENETVFRMLFRLFSEQNPAAMQHLPQLMAVFADSFVDGEHGPKLKDATKLELVALLKALQTQYPAELQQCVAALAPEHQQVLAQAFAS